MKLALCSTLLLFACASLAEEPVAIFNTGPKNQDPPKAEEAVMMFELPEGFNVQVFAAEPDVRQPIGMTFDEKGRLWVAENYSYSENPRRWHDGMRDRVIILEDKDGDGKFDERKVFYDKGLSRLTSVEVGFGGVWIMAAPQLLFVPDKDRDGTPDGDAVVMLDGFESGRIGHNVVNGLMWGPDGWLYGRHGIQNTSFVGRPGAARDDRVQTSCGIWRFHPKTNEYEIFASGTTNPWGHDFDEHGHLFFTNTVIGHLWNAVRGAQFKRMYGAALVPNVYELIDQCADHYHWDTGKSWTASRKVVGATDELGGGHAHIGCMIYQESNWPEKYRNRLFTVNMHGRRLNQEILVREGNSFTGKHAEDILKSSDIWFRGLELRPGPDGTVYINDWSDIGECHDNDGIHRTSGRIYRVSYGEPKKVVGLDLGKKSDMELVDLLASKDEWYSRIARRLLQEREPDLGEELRKRIAETKDVRAKLRYLWALHGIGAADDVYLEKLASDQSEHVRVWAIRLKSNANVFSLEKHANDPSGLVRLQVASELQRLDVSTKLIIGKILARHEEDAHDRMQPLMIWYGIEPVITRNLDSTIDLIKTTKIPKLKIFAARRLVQDKQNREKALEALLGLEISEEVLLGIADGLRGVRKMTPPANWEKVSKQLQDSDNEAVSEAGRELGIVFGDGRATEALLKMVMDRKRDTASRVNAIETLAQAKEPKLIPQLQKLSRDVGMGVAAIRAMAAYDDPELSDFLIKKLSGLRSRHAQAAVGVLVSRKDGAMALLEGMANGSVSRQAVTPFEARQMAALGDEEVSAKLDEVWGAVRSTPKEKLEKIAKWNAELTDEEIAKGNMVAGAKVFEAACATCHKLKGKGGLLGPDLTGSDRKNLAYLLENTIDPGGMVAKDYRISIVKLKDGKTLTGVLESATKEMYELTAPDGKMTLPKDEVENVQVIEQSLMPEGLLDALSKEQVRDLIAYLMKS